MSGVSPVFDEIPGLVFARNVFSLVKACIALCLVLTHVVVDGLMDVVELTDVVIELDLGVIAVVVKGDETVGVTEQCSMRCGLDAAVMHIAIDVEGVWEFGSPVLARGTS